MPHSIDCDDRWVNLDHVVQIRYQQCRNPGLLFCDANGRVIGIKTNCPRGFDFDEAVARVVPAGVGATAVIISAFCGETSLGRPDDTFSAGIPIAAWRIVDGTALPVLVEALSPADRVFFVLPDGSAMEPERGTYASIAAARGQVLLEAQGDWDRKHADAKTGSGGHG